MLVAACLLSLIAAFLLPRKGGLPPPLRSPSGDFSSL
jgi:hypothetical protein